MEFVQLWTNSIACLTAVMRARALRSRMRPGIDPSRGESAPHLRQFLVGAIKELDLTIVGSPIRSVQRQQLVANLLDACGRGERVIASVHTQMRTRHDQFINLKCVEMLQRRNKIVSTVSAEAVRPDDATKSISTRVQ